MEGNFKQCPNGHYYQGAQCPYCKNVQGKGESATSSKTEVFDDYSQGGVQSLGAQGRTVPFGGEAGGGTHAPTMPMGGSGGGEKTTVLDGDTMVAGVPPRAAGGSTPMSGRTVFGDDDETEVVATPGGEKVQRVYREARKLVGWLVSYTLDPMGVDFKLYEGRNIIGRDQDCNITINDNMVSAKHAVLLFRSGKYSITDSQSSHGTFVNGNDIDLEPCYLQDGDVIKVGHTMLKFRTSL